MPGDDDLAAFMALYIFHTGGCIAAMALNAVSLAEGLGYVDLTDRSVSPSVTYRAAFTYGGVCLGISPADAGRSRASILSNASQTVSTTCLPYAEATEANVARHVALGAPTIAAAAAEAATVDLSLCLAGGILGMLAILACTCHNRRALRMCCQEQSRVRPIYAITTRFVVSVLLIAVTGGIMCAATLGSLAETAVLLSSSSSSSSSSSWSAFIRTSEGRSSSSFSVDNNLSSENWMGIWQAIPLALGTFFGLVMEGITYLWAPNLDHAIWPCLPTTCCGGNRDEHAVGCCSEQFISPDDCDSACNPCIASRRRTTHNSIDNWVADWWRLCGMPPIVGVHLASMVIGIIAVSGPVFTYTATGTLSNNGSTTLSTSAKFEYTMSMTQACLSSQSADLLTFGYATRDCFSLLSPRRLTLAPPSPTSPAPGEDFSVLAMGASASTVLNTAGAAALRALCATIIVLLFIVGLFCNQREGAAARAFRCWGKFAGAGMGIAAVVGAITAGMILSSRDSLGSNPWLAVFRGAVLDDDDDYGEDLQGISNPVAGPLTFVARRSDIDIASGDGDDLIGASFGLGVASAVMALPVALAIFCGSFLGTGAAGTADPGAAGTTADASSDTATGGSASSPSSRTRSSSNPVATEKVVCEADKARYGCLMSVTSVPTRKRYQGKADALVQQVRQVRSSGLPETIVEALMASRPKIVRRRVEEILKGSDSGSTPGTSKAGAGAVSSATASVPSVPKESSSDPVFKLGPGATTAPPPPASYGTGAAVAPSGYSGGGYGGTGRPASTTAPGSSDVGGGFAL